MERHAADVRESVEVGRTSRLMRIFLGYLWIGGMGRPSRFCGVTLLLELERRAWCFGRLGECGTYKGKGDGLVFFSIFILENIPYDDS